jgi:hypothetical protein
MALAIGLNLLSIGMFSRTEREGFEPSLGFPKLDFESSAFNRSATSPELVDYFTVD